jgi:hypothetical protein
MNIALLPLIPLAGAFLPSLAIKSGRTASAVAAMVPTTDTLEGSTVRA